MLKIRSICAPCALLLALLLASLPSALHAQIQGDKVYALRGVLTVATDQPFGHYLRMSNRFLGIGAGEHTITGQHRGRIVPGHLRVWWQKEANGRDE